VGGGGCLLFKFPNQENNRFLCHLKVREAFSLSPNCHIFGIYMIYLSDLWKWFNYSQEKAMYIDENKHVWHFHLFEKSKCNTMMNKKDMMNLCQILADLEKQNKVETISYLIAYMIKRFTLSPRR